MPRNTFVLMSAKAFMTSTEQVSRPRQKGGLTSIARQTMPRRNNYKSDGIYRPHAAYAAQAQHAHGSLATLCF